MTDTTNGHALKAFTVRLPEPLMHKLHAHCVYRSQQEGTRVSYSQALAALVQRIPEGRVDDASLASRKKNGSKRAR